MKQTGRQNESRNLTARPANTQQVIPFLTSPDIAASLAFLERAFGMETRFMHRQDGTVVHGQAGIGDAIVMLGMHRPGAKDQAAALGGSGILVYVDDVDAHCGRARAAGATIVADPQEGFAGSDRGYMAADLDGNRWCFATHVPEE